MIKLPPTESVYAIGSADAWGQLVHTCLRNSYIIGTQYGNRSKDMCCVTEILQPYLEPMLHPDFPTKELHCGVYTKQWEREYDWIKQGFEYNYMDRFIDYPVAERNCDREKFGEKHYNNSTQNNIFVDQILRIKEMLPKGISRRIQAITWIPDRDLFVKEDQPCLQRLWFRNLGDRNVEMHCMWRSRDLFAAWNSNMVGLLTMVKKEILEPNNLKLVKVVDFCNSLHIYEADWKAAELVKRISVNPQMRGRFL